MGAWYKKGTLKFFDPCKLSGGLEINYHKFSSKNWVYMLFYGLTRIFHGKEGGLNFFWVWRRGPHFFFLHQAPCQVFVNGPLWIDIHIESIHFTHAWSITKGVRSRSIPHSNQSNAWPWSDLAGTLKVHLLHVHVVLLNDLNTV